MITDKGPSSLDQIQDDYGLLIKEFIDDALNGETFNYNKMFNMFEQLKIMISEHIESKKNFEEAIITYKTVIRIKKGN